MSLDIASLSSDSAITYGASSASMREHMGGKGSIGELLGHNHIYYTKCSQLGQHQGGCLISCDITKVYRDLQHEGRLECSFHSLCRTETVFRNVCSKLQKMCIIAVLGDLFHM